jgi:hypothetical protein
MKTRKFFQFFLIFTLFESLVSCRTVRVVEQVPVYVHDTLRLTQTLHDSIYIDHFREVTQMNDTIYITDEVTKTVTKIVTDTAYRYIEKPVTLTETETVEVAKPLRWWQKALMWSGVAAVVVLLAVLLAKFWQLFRR